MFLDHNTRRILISRYGVSHPSRFEMRMSIPRGFNQNTSNVIVNFDRQLLQSAERLSLACEQSDLPGKLFSTVERRTYSVNRMIPYGVMFEDITMSFRLSEDMFEKRFFEDWQNLIQNPITKAFGYYDDFVADIEIFEYSADLKRVVHGIRLIEAYPFSVFPLNLTTESTNEYLKQSVAFKYKEWKELDVVTDVVTNREETIFSFPSFNGIIRNLLPNNIGN